MIIQTGMRTDIPAFYSKWFVNRIKEGFVCTRNPYNPSQVTRYSLSPNLVDVIGFCSKNPGPMLEHLNVLEPYGQYWHVTITPYGRDIEPRVPSYTKVMEDFIILSKVVGEEAMGWRYDPIFINENYTVEHHLKVFREMAEKLAGHTHSCVISFIDMYEKTKRNFPEVNPVPKEIQLEMGKKIIEIASRCDMVVRPCAETEEFEDYGADCKGCMTQPMYEAAIGARLNVPKAHSKSQRAECNCLFGRDIGQYNTCGHLCKYCYANYDNNVVRKNMRLHDVNSPFLIGNYMDGDVVHEAEQTSWIDYQISMF